MRRWLVIRGPDLGLLGVGVVLAATLLTALSYSNPTGGFYDPLNQAVSDLGEWAISDLAWVFNLGLVTGGALIALSMVSLALRETSPAGRIFGTLGTLTGIAVISLGVLPMDDVEGHLFATVATFGGITLAATWFAGWVLDGGASYPRWLGGLAAWVVITMLVFVAAPIIIQPDWTFAMQFETDRPPRPDIWLASLLEWLAIASALIWLALISWHDRRMGAPT